MYYCVWSKLWTDIYKDCNHNGDDTIDQSTIYWGGIPPTPHLPTVWKARVWNPHWILAVGGVRQISSGYMSSWVYNNYTDGPTAGNRIPELELHSMMYPFLPNLISNQLLGFCLTYYINSICNYVQHYQSWPVVSMWHWLCPSTLLSQPTRSPNDSTAVATISKSSHTLISVYYTTKCFHSRTINSKSSHSLISVDYITKWFHSSAINRVSTLISAYQLN